MTDANATPTDPKFQDLTGRRFGRLTVTGYGGRLKTHGFFWHCHCDCGTEKTVHGCALRNGTTVSCGCYAKETAHRRNRRHGMARTPTHRSWSSMFVRCNQPAASNYAEYGGRGIKVCGRWRSFENFLADMGEKPTPEHTIDRIDNSKGYEPGNCRWATMTEQARNRSNTRLHAYHGETLAMAEWARRAGMSRCMLYHRLRIGWSFERAITTPVGGKPPIDV